MALSSMIGRGLPLVLVALIGVVLWQNRLRQPDAPGHQVHCPDLSAGCTVQVDGKTLSLGVSGDLKPLKPFQLWVRHPGAHKAEVHFTMEGMDMGFNVYSLKADGQGVFRGTVTLPVCVSGRRDWVMTLDMDDVTLEVPFVTQL